MFCLRRLVVLIVILSMTLSSISCTTMKPIPLTGDSSIAARVKAGDRIQYHTAFGKTEELKVTSVDGEMIKGTNNGQERVVLVADVRSIEKRRFSILKTSGLVLGIVLGLVALAAATIEGDDCGAGPYFDGCPAPL